MDKNRLQQASDDMYFDCDNCSTKFTIDSGGFLGEQRHLIKLINKESSALGEADNPLFNCSPFTSLISLCNVCLTKAKKKNDK